MSAETQGIEGTKGESITSHLSANSGKRQVTEVPKGS
jgi:hypothetical protein